MKPGLTVPVVLPTSGPLSGVAVVNSARGTHPSGYRVPVRLAPVYWLVTRLYSRAKPSCRIFGLIVSESVVGPVSSVVGLVKAPVSARGILVVPNEVKVTESVGTATATVALIVSGRNHATESGRSPKPLPI